MSGSFWGQFWIMLGSFWPAFGPATLSSMFPSSLRLVFSVVKPYLFRTTFFGPSSSFGWRATLTSLLKRELRSSSFGWQATAASYLEPSCAAYVSDCTGLGWTANVRVAHRRGKMTSRTNFAQGEDALLEVSKSLVSTPGLRPLPPTPN